MIEALLMLAQGPLSKWSDERPSADFVAEANLYDVERCLIDLPNLPAPQVFRQPDRPDRVTLVHLVRDKSISRVDLDRSSGKLRVLAWRISENTLRRCAP